MTDEIIASAGLSQHSIQRLHSYYLLTYDAHRAEPEIWTLQHCNRILTSVTSGMQFSWKVIGITPKALSVLKNVEFKRSSGCGITSAHIVPRSQTVARLILAQSPVSPIELINTWLETEFTVLCARGENRTVLPPFIKFPSSSLQLFPNRGVAWRHGQSEIDFLKNLPASLDVTKSH